MRQALFFLLLLTLTVTMLGLIGLASAQGAARTPLTAENSTLEQRFEVCMNSPVCAMEEQFKLMEDISNAMIASLQRIHQTCVTMRYKSCIVPQMVEVAEWDKMHGHLRDIMQAMEPPSGNTVMNTVKPLPEEASGERMNMLEPAAGFTPNPYTKPEQEQMERQKNEWWKDWFPADEDNPYHKW
jgi:hypothetical protein